MDTIRRKILHILPFLAFIATACAAATPAVSSPQLVLQPRPGLPAPLQILSVQRLEGQQDSRFPPPDFGKSIALGDGILAVGAPSISGGPDFSAPGSVTTYHREADGWVQDAKLTASDQDDGFQYAQHFGQALALQGKVLFVGAPAADDPQAGDNTGAVYIFEKRSGNWAETAILRSPAPKAEAGFGSQLAVSGGHLGILEGDRFQGGRLYLFQNQGGDWRQMALIEIPAPEGKRGGVAAFDLGGDMLAVGSLTYQGEAAQTEVSGQVLLYHFDGETWAQTGSLPPGIFGEQLAFDGFESAPNRLVIASRGWQNEVPAETVAIFTRSGAGWALEETLASPDSPTSPFFGSGFGGAVAIQGDLLLAGSPGYSEDAFWDGAAYLYQHSTGRWFEQLRLIPPEDGCLGDFFGSEVAISGSTLLVSAPDEFGNAVYVFEVGIR